MSKALHFRPLVRDHRAVSKKPVKTGKSRRRPKLELIHGTPKLSPQERILNERIVEVFDRDGHLIASYSVVLESSDCHDAEFEEVALIFAEQSGRVTVEELIHLRARCLL